MAEELTGAPVLEPSSLLLACGPEVKSGGMVLNLGWATSCLSSSLKQSPTLYSGVGGEKLVVAVMKSLPYVCVGLWPACDELHCVSVMVTVCIAVIIIYEFVWRGR